MTKKNINDIYTDFYLNQAGSGFGNVYAGGIYQKGYGIGSFLGGLFRCVFPLLKSGSSVLGSELLKSGANIISDISKNHDPEFVIKNRGKETINNLSRIMGEQMFGNGYNYPPNRKRLQSLDTTQRVKKFKETSKTISKRKSKNNPKKTSKNKSSTRTNTENKIKSKKRTKEDIFDFLI